MATREIEVLSVASADGTRIGCEVAGAGPPLLLVHGSTADRSRWATVREALAARFTLHLMDRRGRGLSAAETPGRYALAREAEDVAAVLGAIGPDARVLAHSYGGTCALAAVAGADGARAARLCVYEPAFGTPVGPVFPAAALDAVEAAIARDDPEAALETFFADVLLLGEGEIEAMRGTPLWRARVACAHTLAREARAANAFTPAPRIDAGAPVRFLLGTETAAPLVRSTRAAHAAVPGSSVRELPGQGHAAMDSAPDLFVAEVSEWLSP
jgi:pimeloyl-ACP methyl ester carboxylesterase